MEQIRVQEKVGASAQQVASAGPQDTYLRFLAGFLSLH